MPAREHGVMPGQAVMDARGMIGRIYLTGQRTSWVILLTDLNSPRSRLHRVGGRPAMSRR